MMELGALQAKLERLPAAKAMLGVVIFCLIVGGWTALERHRAASARLPRPPQRQEHCSLWFVGSSSIYRWTTLARDMAPWTAYNRGIDNGTFAEILPRFANAAEEPRPAAIILYAGENDIARGAPVREVIRSLGAFLASRDRGMGGVPVLILSMKPSPGRKANFGAQQLFNDAARRVVAQTHGASFGDITAPLLKGGSMGDHYQADGVHMNLAGYRIWGAVVRQQLPKMLPATTVAQCEARRAG